MILYKYKSIKNIEDIDRVLEIFNSSKIYLPRANQLNDVFEGCARRFEFSYAGSSIATSAGELPQGVDELVSKYGILSLTKKCDNPVMWSTYANDYCGVCIGLIDLKLTKKVKYLDKKEIDDLPPITEFDDADIEFQQSILIKNKLWKYEEEYRIISKTDQYLDIQNKIKCVIIGHKTPLNISKAIYDVCKKYEIMVYKSYIDYSSNKVIILDYNYEIYYDGSEKLISVL